MSKPAVSIIIPTYNRAAFLGRALASVAAQSWTDYEIIVVDDASTDETPTFLRARGAAEPRLRVVNHRRGPHGPAGARNAGLAVARADWVAFLDSDDEWAPDKLAHFVAAIADGVVLIGSDYHILGESNEPEQTMRGFLDRVMIPWWRDDPLAQPVLDARALQADPGRLADPTMIRAMTMGGFLWPQTSSVMVRRAAVEDAGRFDVRLARTEDMDLWLKLLDRGRFVFLDRPLARYHTQGRTHANGPRYDQHARARRHDQYLELRAHLRMLKSLPRRFPMSPAARRYWCERVRMQHHHCAQAAQGTRPLTARWHGWLAHRWPRHRAMMAACLQALRRGRASR